MKNLLAQLESNEAVLMMYLSGELPRRDREEVEHLLAHDGGIRAELERLRATMRTIGSALAPEETPAELNVDAAILHTQLAVRQWLTETGDNPRSPRQVEKSLPLPWWTYPLAAAASVLLALAVWLVSVEPRSEVAGGRITYANGPGNWAIDFPIEQPADPIEIWEARPLAEELVLSFDESDAAITEALLGSGLLSAAKELEEIQNLRQQMSGL